MLYNSNWNIAINHKRKLCQEILLLNCMILMDFLLILRSLMATENGWTVDEDGLNEEMQQQKNRSRAATALDTEDWIVLNDNNTIEFVGYDSLETKAQCIKIQKGKSKRKRGLPNCTGYNTFLRRKRRTGGR